MVVKSVRRTVRLFNIEVRQREPNDQWQTISFRSVAELLQQLPTDVSASPNRYLVRNGERWHVDFRDVGGGLGVNPILAICFRGREEDLPIIERDGAITNIIIQEGQALAERNVFGVFDNNRLVFQVSRHGLYAAHLSMYLTTKVNEILQLRGEPRRIHVDITQLVRPTFEDILREAISFTRLHIRPRYDAIGRLNSLRRGSSMIRILSDLMKISKHSAEIRVSAGRNPRSDDAFLNEFADWARENIQDFREDDLFEIFEGSALTRSGEIRLFDLLDRHVFQKRVSMQLRDGVLDTDHAIGRLGGVYNDFVREESRE